MVFSAPSYFFLLFLLCLPLPSFSPHSLAQTTVFQFGTMNHSWLSHLPSVSRLYAFSSLLPDPHRTQLTPRQSCPHITGSWLLIQVTGLSGRSEQVPSLRISFQFVSSAAQGNNLTIQLLSTHCCLLRVGRRWDRGH